MANYLEKRFTKLEFEPGKWGKATGEDGKRTYTATAAGWVKITRTDGTVQEHTGCPIGSKVISDGACAECEIL